MVQHQLVFLLAPAATFLVKLGEEVGLQTKVVNVLPNSPVVVMTWLGQQPKLTSILLNSHIDVVPVFPVIITLYTLFYKCYYFKFFKGALEVRSV